jgi:hypothetical protein
MDSRHASGVGAVHSRVIITPTHTITAKMQPLSAYHYHIDSRLCWDIVELPDLGLFQPIKATRSRCHDIRVRGHRTRSRPRDPRELPPGRVGQPLPPARPALCHSLPPGAGGAPGERDGEAKVGRLGIFRAPGSKVVSLCWRYGARPRWITSQSLSGKLPSALKHVFRMSVFCTSWFLILYCCTISLTCVKLPANFVLTAWYLQPQWWPVVVFWPVLN